MIKRFARTSLHIGVAVIGFACALLVLEIQRMPAVHHVNFSMFAPAPYFVEVAFILALAAGYGAKKDAAHFLTEDRSRGDCRGCGRILAVGGIRSRVAERWGCAGDAVVVPNRERLPSAVLGRTPRRARCAKVSAGVCGRLPCVGLYHPCPVGARPGHFVRPRLCASVGCGRVLHRLRTQNRLG